MLMGAVDGAGQYADHVVRVSGILDVGPALLFEMPEPDPRWLEAARARREVRRCHREATHARRLLDRERWAVVQTKLPLLPLPRTVGDCRGPGICPVLRCKFHLVLWVKDNGSIKVGRAHEKGRTLKVGQRATDARLEHAADLVVEMIDRLADVAPTACVIDYAEQARGQNADETYTAIARVLGCGKQRARVLVLEAIEEYEHARDIEEARARRAGLRGAQGRPAPAASPLVQIRFKRGAPAMKPGPDELAKVGD